MSNVAIVYMSKYGHTKQYADWLKEEIGAEVIALGSFNVAHMLSYKLVIFASGIYGDKIQIMDFIKKNSTAMNLQKIMIAAVGWYTNGSEEAKEKLIQDNYPDNLKNIVPLYLINSGIDKKKASVMEKAQLLAAQVMIEKKDGRSSDDINALAIIKGYSDQTSKDNLELLKKGIDLFFNPPKPEPKPEPIPEPITEKPIVDEIKHEPAKVSQEFTADLQVDVKKPVLDAEEIEDLKAIDSAQQAFSKLKHSNPVHTAPQAEAPSNGVVVTSLDDALAALSGGSVFTKPLHKPTPLIEEVKEVDEQVLPTVESIATSEDTKVDFDVIEDVSENFLPPAEDTIVKSSESNLVIEKVEEISTDTLPTAEEAEIYSNEISPAIDEVEEISTANLPTAEEVTPVITEVGFDELPDTVLSINDELQDTDEVVMSISDDIENVNTIIDEPATFTRPEAAKKPEAAPPRKNSYLEIFSRRNKPEVEEPKPVVEEPKPISKVTDYDFELLGDIDNVSAPIEKTVVTEHVIADTIVADKVSEPTISDVFDFMTDNTVSQPSSRAMNAVNALAKAKEEAEKAAQKAAEELEKAISTPADIAEDTAAEARDEAPIADVLTASEDFITEPESVVAQTIGVAVKDFDDDIVFNNDAEYDVSDEIVISEPNPGKGKFDFKRLQMEIEASIETNKKKKEKDRLRNTRELDRNNEEEESQAPKKGIKQPMDADLFFQRPGKDYYDSDTMPEIKFDRHKRG